MVVQIPLTWQLTDLIGAMGLGLGYGAVYWAARGILAPLCPQGPRLRRLRKWLRYLLDGLWGAGAALFTRAWVLTDSRAAQVRWSIVLGVAVGCAAFWLGLAPVLSRWGARGSRLAVSVVGPPVRAVSAVWRRLRLWLLPRRERRRLRYELRALRLSRRRREREAARQSAAQTARRPKNTKEFQKNIQKELQTPGRMYYNNL